MKIKSGDFRYKRPEFRPKKGTRPAKVKKKGIFSNYASYNFIDKDPIIHEVEDAVKASGMTYEQIEHESGVSKTTLWAWFRGDTKRPQSATIRAVLRSIGYDVQVVKASAPVTGNFSNRPAGRHLKVVGGRR